MPHKTALQLYNSDKISNKEANCTRQWPVQLNIRDGWISDPAFRIWQNLTPGGLHVSRHIRPALITVSTSVRQSATADISSSSRASVWFAACVEWLANDSNRPSQQVHLLRPSVHCPRPRRNQSISHTVFLPNVCFPQAVMYNRQFIRRPA